MVRKAGREQGTVYKKPGGVELSRQLFSDFMHRRHRLKSMLTLCGLPNKAVTYRKKRNKKKKEISEGNI